MRKTSQVMVEDVNLKKKRTPIDGGEFSRGQIRIITHPLPIGYVSLIDPETNLPGKVDIGFKEDGSKVRIFKKTGSILELPERMIPSYSQRHSDKVDGPLDTPSDIAHEVLEVRELIAR